MRKLMVVSILMAASIFSVALCQAQEKSNLISNLGSGKKQTVIAYGTSLTASGIWVDHLRRELNKRYFLLVTVINSGKDAMWSKWGLDNIEQLVIQKKPDTVFIEFAINDAYLPYKTSVEDARRNLEGMIDALLKYNPECEIILMVMNPPIEDSLKKRPKFKDYYQMYYDVAKERKLKLIDHYQRWNAMLIKDIKLFKKYVPDGIHPSPYACEHLITPKILEALGISE